MPWKFNIYTGTFDYYETGGGGGGGTVTSIAGGVALTATPVDPITGSGTLDLDLNSLTTEATLASDDLFGFVDVSVGTSPSAQRKVTLANLLVGLEALGINADTLDGLDSTAFQPIDADLTALAALATTGLAVRTGAGTWATRAFAVTDSLSIDFTITDGDGVAGNPTLTGTVLPAGVDHNSLANLTTGDPHLRYLLLDGRALGANNFVMSTDTSDGRIFGRMNTAGAGSTGLVLRGSADGADGILTVANGSVGIVLGGHATITPRSGAARELRFRNPADTFYSSLKAGAQTAQFDYTLPTTITTNGFLKTDAGGVLSWATLTTGDLPSIDHGSLTGLPDDDHAQYLLLAGRTGSTNDPILSTTTTGLLSGSLASGQNLDLQSTIHGTKGFIRALDEVILQPNLTGAFTSPHEAILFAPTYTLTAGSKQMKVLKINNQVTVAGGTPVEELISQDVRYTATTNAPSGFIRGIESFIRLESATAGARPGIAENIHAGLAILANANDIGTYASGYGIRVAHEIQAVASGAAVRVTDLVGFSRDNWVINAIPGATVQIDTATAFRIQDLNPVGAGTEILNTSYGIDIEDLDAATTNIAFRSQGAAASVRIAGPTRIGDVTAPTEKLEVAGNILVTGILYGGAAASDDLELQSTSNTTKGAIRLNDHVVLWPDFTMVASATNDLVDFNTAFTFPAGANTQFRGLNVDAAITMSNGAPLIQFLAYAPVVTQTTNPSFYTVNCINAAPTYQSATNGVGPLLPDTFLDTTVIKQTVGTSTSTLHAVTLLNLMESIADGASVGLTYESQVGLWSRPIFSGVNGGALVVNNRRAVYVLDPVQNTSGGGTISIPSNIGLDVNDQTIGTVRASVRSLMTTGAGKWHLLCSGSAASAHTGPLRLGDTTVPTEILEVLGNAIVTGTLYGGNGSGDTLQLESTSHATKATIDMRDRLLLYTNVPTAPTGQAAADFTATLTTSALSQNFSGYRFVPTINSTHGVYIPQAFVAGGTWAPTAGNSNVYTALAVNPALSSATTTIQVPGALLMNNTLSATASSGGSNGTTTTYASLNENPVFTATGASTAWTITNINTVTSNCTLTSATGGGTPSSLTATTRRGLNFNDATKNATGTIVFNTQVAVDIAALSAATTNLSLRSAGSAAEMRHAGSAVFAANAAPTNASVGLEVQSTTKALLVSRMTTTQRDAMTALDGMIIYNTTTNAFNFRENGAWVTGSGLV